MILERIKLNDSNALVTGARAGIGAGICAALAEVGANVALHGRETPPEKSAASARATGQEVVALTGGMADPSACEASMNAALRKPGPIDILVNNAAIIRRAPAAQILPFGIGISSSRLISQAFFAFASWPATTW